LVFDKLGVCREKLSVIVIHFSGFLLSIQALFFQQGFLTVFLITINISKVSLFILICFHKMQGHLSDPLDVVYGKGN
jgi:hypothetical protein